MAAGEHWVACIDQRSIDKSLDEDIKHMPELAGRIEHQRLADLVVFDCNWMALEVFLNCTNQWRLSPMGDIQSLDYASVRAVLEMMGIKRSKWADTFQRVRLIESGALPALRKLRERK